MNVCRTALLASAFVLSAVASAASAQALSHLVYLDLDSNATTGCATALAAVTGIEARLTATVLGEPPTVSAVVRQDCVGGAFGPAQAQLAEYPVGLNNGTGNADVIELATALRGLGKLPPVEWATAWPSPSAVSALRLPTNRCWSHRAHSWPKFTGRRGQILQDEIYAVPQQATAGLTHASFWMRGACRIRRFTVRPEEDLMKPNANWAYGDKFAPFSLSAGGRGAASRDARREIVEALLWSRRTRELPRCI